MIVQQLTTVLSNYFASPTGFLALLSLIPLALFYFMKPEPEERIMPSMAFFMKKKKSGKMEQALSRLMANLLLLLHILFIIGAAAAIAQPYIMGEQKPENAVIVMDVSASMHDDFGEAKKFAKSNLGKENTIIIAENDAEVKAESVSSAQARRIISSLEAKDVETDIVSGLEIAQSYKGRIVIASDLVQTSTPSSAKQLAESIKAERKVSFYDASQDNRWGIVDVGSGENSYVEIKNFMDKSATIDVNTPQGVEKVEVNSGEVDRLELETSVGRNTVSLPEDGFKPDNKAHISTPESRTVEVTYIGDEKNPYFKEAVKAMDFTEFNSVTTPVKQDLDADIYVVGETNQILKTTASDLESEAKNGDSLILFGQRNLQSKGFDSAPARIGNLKNATVDIKEPRRLNAGKMEIYATSDINGSSWSNPSGALVKRKYGSGNILLYNLDDEEFRYDFYYPIFWKEVFQRLENRRSAAQLNVETGTEIDDQELVNAGFHNVSGSTFAANLESAEESASEPVKISDSADTDRKGKKQIQNLAAALLAVLVALELLYLAWIGEA